MCESYDPVSGPSQTDQSGLETKACCVLFLLRHEYEEFFNNLFHLVFMKLLHLTVCEMCH